MPNQYDRSRLEQYVTTGSQSVAGYLHSGAASVIWSIIDIQDELEITGNLAEFGVYHGKLFIALCLALRTGERAFAIDVFDTQPEIQGIETAADRRRFSADNLRANLAAQDIDAGLVHIMAADSQALTAARLAATPGLERVRIFSVDGDHSRRGVRHDLNLAAAVLADGGVILADDLFNTLCPSLTEGIIDFFGADNDGRLAPVAIVSANGPQRTGSNKLILAAADHAERYKAYLQLLNRDDYSHSDEFLGFAHVLVFDFKDPPTKHPLDDAVRGAVATYFAAR